MATGLLKKITFRVVIALGAALWLTALVLLARTTQSSTQFDRLQDWILLVNAAGVLVLLLLLVASLYRLLRDYRNHVPGARLKGRMLAMFAGLAVLPLILVYYYALQFINQGIDSWFDVDVEQGLQQALELSRLSLDQQMREYLERGRNIVRSLEGVSDEDLPTALSRLRGEHGASELSVFGTGRRILATSTASAALNLPRPPTDNAVLQIRQGRPYVQLEQSSEESLRIRLLLALPGQTPGGEVRLLQAFFPLPGRLASLAESVQSSYTRYNELVFLRTPLKYTFTLTLTLILLLSLLAAVYGAFFFARRLVAPIQQLVAGTQAVARGDFDTRLPVPARDEIGFLINSFNDMTGRLARAREDTRVSEQRLEGERANLAVILARLSTGVMALEPDLSIRVVNPAAGAIFDVDPERLRGRPLREAATLRPLLREFSGVLLRRLEAGEREWREQIVLRDDLERRVLMWACTTLPGDRDQPGGFVVVFDDVTTLVQAQRDAAWGEVARRLAHEIKNPLTPIQLSAERLRRRYLEKMDPEDAKLLNRATHTIVEQVEAMKAMVNAFSEYARAPTMSYARLDLNQLIHEVTDLYPVAESRLSLHLDLDPQVGLVEADAGRLRQILHNLLRNATEALEGHAGGAIWVKTRLQSLGSCPVVRITVEDNGPGFQTETTQEVFDPYVTTKPKGTGLGLAIVKKLVEEHGGRIEAENRKRRGARVSILFPVDAAAREVMLSQQLRRTGVT